MTFTNLWTAAYELLPTDDDYGYTVDDYIRSLKVDIRERAEIDHAFEATGKHDQLTLLDVAFVSDVIDGEGVVFVNGELYYRNYHGTVQLTREGIPYDEFVGGTRMAFFQDSAPAGWTVYDSTGDKLLAVKGGAGSFNVAGGIVAGTWVQPEHQHDAGEYVASGTTGIEDSGAGTGAFNIYQLSIYPHHHTFTATPTGKSALGSTANTWRPLCSVSLICEKDYDVPLGELDEFEDEFPEWLLMMGFGYTSLRERMIL